MAFIPITPTDVSPGIAGSFQDVDCSALIAAGATGVILHIVNTSSTGERLGLQKKGSGDNRNTDCPYNTHFWAMIGVDENRIFQAYIVDASIHIWLIGYTTSGVTFFTDGSDKTFAPTGAWTDIDCSAICPDATGIIIEVSRNKAIGPCWGFRKKGGTDEHYPGSGCHRWVIIGCNASQVIRGYQIYDSFLFHVVGYVTDGASFRTNGVDKSPTADGAYHEVDCSTEAPGANMLFFEICATSGYNYALRKKGVAEDIYKLTSRHSWAIVECDSEQKVEIKLEDAAVEIYLLGYSLPGAWTGKISGVTNPAKVMGVDSINIAKVKGV